MSVEDISIGLKIATFLVSTIGVLVAFLQWRRSLSIKRAEFINGIFEKFRTDYVIRTTTYFFDYVQDWYSEKFHHFNQNEIQYAPEEKGMSLEAKVDISLRYLSYICYLFDIGILKERDFALFKYKICRTIQNYGVQDYLYNLYHFSIRQGIQFPFPAILAFAKRERLLSKNFFLPESYMVPDTGFHKYLNF